MVDIRCTLIFYSNSFAEKKKDKTINHNIILYHYIKE